jgi:rare lipoprotein A (peptidoglycan hydrolase)
MEAGSELPFDRDKYTAAHKKLPFGTKLRITESSEWTIG